MKNANHELDDIAGGPIPLRAPISQRAFGSSRLVQTRDGTVTSEFLSPLEHTSVAQLQFSSPEGEAEYDAIDGLLAGVPPENELCWVLLVYETMRRQGLWPVNLPLEQLLAEEHVNIYWPEQAAPWPAALQ